MDSKWVAWRMAFLAAFILSMMVNINYGASLVSSLLSTPVKTIRTTRDLIDSSLQFAAEDISYSLPYFEVSNNVALFAHFNQLHSCHQIRSEMRYAGCPRRKGQKFGKVFLMLKYTDITQNTYIQS